MKSKKELIYEIKVSTFASIVAVIYFILVKTGIPWNGKMLPGIVLKPTLFPDIVSYLFLFAAAVMLVKSLLDFCKFVKDTTNYDPAADTFKISPFPVKQFLPVLAAFIVYFAVLKFLGFILATITLSLFLMFYISKDNPLRNIIFSVCFTILVYMLFDKILTIYLPKGLLQFI